MARYHVGLISLTVLLVTGVLSPLTELRADVCIQVCDDLVIEAPDPDTDDYLVMHYRLTAKKFYRPLNDGFQLGCDAAYDPLTDDVVVDFKETIDITSSTDCDTPDFSGGISMTRQGDIQVSGVDNIEWDCGNGWRFFNTEGFSSEVPLLELVTAENCSTFCIFGTGCVEDWEFEPEVVPGLNDPEGFTVNLKWRIRRTPECTCGDELDEEGVLEEVLKLELITTELQRGSCDDVEGCDINGPLSCDLNDDGMVTVEDFDQYLIDNGSPTTDSEKRDLLCEYLSGCGGNDDPCELAELGLKGIYGDDVTQQEIDDFLDCWTDNYPGGGAEADCKKLQNETDDLRCDEEAKPGEGDPDCETDNPGDPANAPEGSQPETGRPVDLVYGYKSESATDLTIALPGRDFVLRRNYRSDRQSASGADPALVGEGWTTDAYKFVSESPASDCDTGANRSPVLYETRRKYTFEWDATDSHWKRPGSTSQYMTMETITDDGTDRPSETLTATAVWRLTQPGSYECDYYRAACSSNSENDRADHIGLLRVMRDVYGNEWTYYYSNTADPQSSDVIPRLDSIVFRTPDPATAGVLDAAKVEFTYNTTTDAYNYGKLTKAEAYRWVPGSPGSWEKTQEVAYTYKDRSDSYSDAVGMPGDLIQVVRKIAVDDSEDMGVGLWRPLVTQYRYHNPPLNEFGTTDTDGDGYVERGQPHQLKMCLEPEQIEWYAQKAIDDLGMSGPDDLEDAANDLLLLDDEDASYSGSSNAVADLASKVVAVYDLGEFNGQVREMYLQASCGCGGGSLQGLKQEFDYYEHASGTYKRTTRLRQRKQLSGGGYGPYRTTYYYYTDPRSNGVPYLGAKVVMSNESGDDRYWISGYNYDSDGNLTDYYTPAADATGSLSGTPYTPPAGDGDTPSYTPSTTAGLVYSYEYTDDNRRTKTKVREGTTGTAHTVTETVYPTSPGTNERLWLPNEIKRYRVAGTVLAAEIERTQFSYAFHSGDALEFVATHVEAETEAENGPGGWYSSVEFFDEQGRLSTRVSEDSVLTLYEYDADVQTGKPTSVTSNWDGDALDWFTKSGDDLDGTSPAVDTSDWGTRAGGELTTTYAYDNLGRRTSTTLPGGVTTYIAREMRDESVERPGIVYYAEVALPHKIATSEFSGPAHLRWFNADGDVIRSSDYPVSSFTSATNYTLSSTEASRSTVVHGISGLVEETNAWHDIPSGFYTTTLEYDALGRPTKTTNDNGTITERVYDALDRVVEQKVGTSGSNMETVVEVFYDHTLNGSTPEQGVGNGNVTFVRRHVDDSTTRDTTTTYDFRDRAIAVENPDVPHTYTVYDHLDRPTTQIVFKGTLANLETDLANADVDRGRWTETSYSQRGLVYRQAVATTPAVDPDSSSFKYLESHTWFDQAGRSVGQWGPGGPVIKTTFDGLGRRTAVHVSDRGGDARPGASGSHAHVYDAADFESDLTGDIVLEQAEYRYIAGTASIGAGLMDRVTTHLRAHTASGTGELSLGADAITTYSGTFYDDANRVIRRVAYGTNDTDGFVHSGTAPNPNQASPPDADPTDPELISATAYNDIGLVESRFAPRTYDNGSSDVPYETRFIYDDLYRQVAVIENYRNAVVSWGSTEGRWKVDSGITDAEPDTDRVTSFVYDGSNNIIKRVAHIPSGTSEAVQVTEYDYDYSLTNVIASRDILAEVRYPHETNGTAGTTAEYTVTYEYNRLGELTDMTDQNGTAHEYDRDDLGRVTEDLVTFADPTDIDDWADRIVYTYDDAEWGKLTSVQTKDGSTVKNEIEYAYDDLWQLTSIKMNPFDDVNSSGTREFTYTYSEDSEFDPTASAGDAHNYTRLTSLGYPQIASETAMTVDMTYPSGLDDRISRATGFGFNVNSASNNHTVEHEFVGMGMPVITVYPTPGFQLTRFVDPGYDNPGDSDTADGEYPGLDQFGRVERQVWSGPGVGWGGGSPLNWDPDSLPAIYDLEYTYDYNSNITARTDAREGASLNGRDEEYSYDGIDRLIEAERIESGSSTQRALSQDWALDMLGNWDTYNPDLTIGTKEQDRTHNQANEITGITVNSTAWAATEHDKAGNLTYQGTSSNRRRHFVWDAWNRLVQVDYETDSGGWTGDTRATHTYYGLHQRALTLADEEPDASEDPTRWNAYYYDASWRLLEHRYDDLTSASWTTPPTSFTADETKHYVWGMRYIDELVYYRKAVDEGRYALTDRNFSVIGLMEDDPTDADDERIRYTPYGEAVATLRSDVDFDGDVDGTDRSLVNGAIGNSIGAGGYKVEYDVNRDGTIDTTDRNLVSADIGSSITAGQVSGQGNLVGYDGYIFEPAAGMYCVRHRWYLPEVGRWGSRDPLGYVDGSNQNEHSASSPSCNADPSGLANYRSDPLPRDPMDTQRERERQRRVYQRACQRWITKQQLLARQRPNWWARLPDCPCTIDAEAPCEEGWSPLEDRDAQPFPWDAWKRYHPAGQYQRRSRTYWGGPGQQCIYDKQGKLITGGRSVGTPDLISPTPINLLPLHFHVPAGDHMIPILVPRVDLRYVIAHREVDVDPFEACRRAGMLAQYHKYRPPNNGNNCPENIRD